MQRPGIARVFVCLLLSGALSSIAACVGMTGGGAEEPQCDQRAVDLTLKLKVKTKSADDATPVNVGWDDEGPAVSGKDPARLHTCPGYFVRWVLKDHKFTIRFKDGETPFASPTLEAVQVGKKRWAAGAMVVDVEDADKGVDLKYTIEVVGKDPLDPIIIVDR